MVMVAEPCKCSGSHGIVNFITVKMVNFISVKKNFLKPEKKKVPNDR